MRGHSCPTMSAVERDVHVPMRAGVVLREVPVYAVVGWGDHGIHTRGSLDRQLEFFTTFLKEAPGATLDRPRLNIEVRESHFVGQVRDEITWPLDGTVFTPLFLDAASGALLQHVPAAASVTYDSEDTQDFAEFAVTFDEDTELTGNMSLRLWVDSETDEADLFVAVEKFDRDGERVPFPLQSMFHDGPVDRQRVLHLPVIPSR